MFLSLCKGVMRKGIIFVGGLGIWFYLLIKVVSKQLMLVYDKFMIYYLLIMLMMLGIRDILIIIIFEEQFWFVELLGDGSVWGLNLEYVVQFFFDGLV